MFKQRCFISLCTTLTLVLCWSQLRANELDVIDAMRLSAHSSKVELLARQFHGEQLQSESQYEVYADPGQRSLVLFRSEQEAGQKMLMLGDQYYLFMPNSRRQIRITANQKLLGQASLGDIASLRWSQDYRIRERQRNEQLLQLSLEAARSGLSYERVELWVEAESLKPIRAEFYLASGRLAKEASFSMQHAEQGWQMQAMTLYDRIQQQQRTEVSYLSIEPVSIPESWFNPAYLLRNSL